MDNDPNGFFNKKYVKICIYASVTVVLTLIAIYLVYLTGGFWAKIWALFTAILRPLLIGLILCYLLSPLVSFLENAIAKKKKNKGSRILAILLSYLLVIAVIAALAALILVTAYKNIATINYDSLIKGVTNAITSLQLNFNDLPAKVQEILDLAGISFGGVGSMATEAVNAVFTGLERFFTGMFFGIIFSVYFMLDGSNISKYWENVFRTIFGNAAGDTLQLALDDFNRVFSGYLRGQMLDASIVLVISCILLTLIGVPNSILVGVLIGLGNLIPYVGPIVGYVVLAIVCIPSHAFTEMIIGFICVAVIMFIDANIINPRLLSDNVEVHPLLVVAALIGGGALGGLLGMIIAVPVAAFLKVQLDRYVSQKAEKDAKESASQKPEVQKAELAAPKAQDPEVREAAPAKAKPLPKKRANNVKKNR